LTMTSNGWGLKDLSYLVVNLSFGRTLEDAPVVHFDGPLMIQACLSDDDGPAYILVDIGTPGIGEGSFAAITYGLAGQVQARPVVEIAYPGKDGTIKEESVVLSYDSCACGFHGCLRIDEGLGQGNARLTVQFADWKAAALAPCVLEVPVNRLEWPAHDSPFLGAGCGTKAASKGGARKLRETSLWT
jgi:hypothetical protein